jgi:hypothetical protein
MGRRRRVAAALILGGCGSTAALARISGLRPVHYLGNTLVCQDTTDGATGRLWLNADGSYRIFYDRGHPTVPQSATAPIEERQGTYTTSFGLNGNEVCMTPDASIVQRGQIEQDGEIYAGSACYPLPLKAVGQTWTTTDAAGHSYRMWLQQGR